MRLMDPFEIRFSQQSIKAVFRNNRSIEELAIRLMTGEIDPADIEPIRLVERDGNFFSLDNRRLEAFRRAKVQVPCRTATPEEVARESSKFTTRNQGISVRVRKA